MCSPTDNLTVRSIKRWIDWKQLSRKAFDVLFSVYDVGGFDLLNGACSRTWVRDVERIHTDDIDR